MVANAWSRVAEAIRVDEPRAVNELYESLAGFKVLFARQLGREDADDRYHDLILAIVSSIKSGTLREPGRLVGFARATARHMIADDIRKRQRQRHPETNRCWSKLADDSPSAEATAIRNEAEVIAKSILRAMPVRYRSVLVRYYVHEHDAGRICIEMGLSETQFRLLKSRAKARFTSLMQRRMGPAERHSARHVSRC